MKTILFDFDGVLAHTHLMCYEIHKELNPGLKYDFFQSLSHGNFWEIYNKAVSDKKIIHNTNFHNIYNDRLSDLIMPEELKKVIMKLSEKYSLSIISSTDRSQIIPFLEKEKITNKFEMILGREVHVSKVEKIKKLLSDKAASLEDVIFITDTTGDIIEARECGVKSIAVSWGLHNGENLLHEKPFALVDTPQELEQKIEEFFK